MSVRLVVMSTPPKRVQRLPWPASNRVEGLPLRPQFELGGSARCCDDERNATPWATALSIWS